VSKSWGNFHFKVNYSFNGVDELLKMHYYMTVIYKIFLKKINVIYFD